MDQLEDERSPGYDPSPAGQEIPAHQTLQHWALAAALQAQRHTEVRWIVQSNSIHSDSAQQPNLDMGHTAADLKANCLSFSSSSDLVLAVGVSV